MTSNHPANERPTTDEPLPVPDETLAWEEKMNNMTWDEFVRYLDDADEGGLAFGGV